ncbi:MAG: tetratricopeptide repeat protein [Bacteroidales bacterium]|nr:tetratricopeptide repeat protein [Bacteroidales bacterium]MCB9013191.1 tetratricopeptide repeat protein [Bacteroidales bacterium]
MIRRILIVLILVISVWADFYAQDTNTDSLINLLNEAEGKEKIELYLQISEAFTITDAQKANDFANQSIIYARGTKDDNLIGLAYKNQGSVFDKEYNDLQASEAFQTAISYFEKSGNQKELAYTLNLLATSKNFLNEVDESIKLASRSLEISQKIKDLAQEANSYYTLGNCYYNQNNFEKALEFHKKSLEIRQKQGDKKAIGTSLNRLGMLSYANQDFKKAEEYYQQVLEIRREQNDSRGIGIALLNLGNASNQKGDLDDAIAYYKEAYEIFKQLDFKQGIASTLTGMGVIYGQWQKYNSALTAYLENLAIVEESGNQKEIANTLTNIGIVYNNIITDTLTKIYGENYRDSVYIKKPVLNFDAVGNAIRYHNLSLEKRRETNDIRGIGACLANLGITYSYIGNIKKARQYFEEWLSMADQIQDQDQQVAIYISMGQLYRYEGRYDNAIDYLNRARAIASKINMKTHLQTIADNLSQVYELKGDYKLALDNYKISTQLNDTIKSEAGQKLISEMQVKYETDAKEKENQLLRKDQVINESRLKQQRFAIYLFSFVILAIAFFVILLIRQNNQKKKANAELAKRNALITEQKKEITDSIQYASRIQNAILPPPELITRLIPQHFIIYRPRDIVSGDYYWITEKGPKIYIMAADCTGHGVPGAFMSMLGVAFLNEIVSKHVEITANELLNELRKQVIESLHQTGREGENQDGMDVALYIIDRKEMKLEYSGANNSLFIFRGEEFIELKADKMPIGIHRLADTSFTNYKIDIQKNDMIYSFSDGYPDQFGGPQGKKLMIKNFKKTLQEICDKPLSEQKQILDKTLDDWMAGTHQIDDILVMGVKI